MQTSQFSQWAPQSAYLKWLTQSSFFKWLFVRIEIFLTVQTPHFLQWMPQSTFFTSLPLPPSFKSASYSVFFQWVSQSTFFKRITQLPFFKWLFAHIRGFPLKIISQSPVPRHVAFILDGNRRYAKGHNLSVPGGHRAGSKALMRTTLYCFECGIEVITVYAFSMENFHRSKYEIDGLMALAKEFLPKFDPQNALVKKYGLKVQVLGRVELFEQSLRNLIHHIEDGTRNNQGKVLNICLAYSARDEITASVRRTVATGVLSDNITAESLTYNMFVDHPSLDLVVRTSGVYRLSDFLLWQCHQDTIIKFVQVQWPDFGHWSMLKVLWKWQSQKRQPSVG